MNQYRKIVPEHIVKMYEGTRISQYRAVITAFRLIQQNETMTSDNCLWAATAAAAYRAGRLSMWRDMARLRQRKHKKPSATYRWAIHRMVNQFREKCHLKRLYELTQYLWREEAEDDENK